MPGERVSCRTCGTEFAPDGPAGFGWRAVGCPACGVPVEVWSGWVPCGTCGIAFPLTTAWAAGESPVAGCPTCGATVVVQPPLPAPAPPSVPAHAAPAPRPAPVEREERPRPPRPAPAPVERPRAEPEPWSWPAPAPSPPRRSAEALAAGARATFWVGVTYVVACVLPAVGDGPNSSVPGIICLLFGCLACHMWLPNPLLFFGCRALRAGHNRRALVLGVLACLCTLPLLAGAFAGASDFRLTWGYYVWQFDVFLFTGWSFVLLVRYGPRADRS